MNDRKQEKRRRLASNPLHLERRTTRCWPCGARRNNACRHHRKMGIHRVNVRVRRRRRRLRSARWILSTSDGFLRRRGRSRYDELDSLDRLPSPWGFFVTTFLVAVFFVGCLSGVRGLIAPVFLRLLGAMVKIWDYDHWVSIDRRPQNQRPKTTFPM
jgi:hypothetical protein